MEAFSPGSNRVVRNVGKKKGVRRRKSTVSVGGEDVKRSVSLGGKPEDRRHDVSRRSSTSSGISLDVRCACQFFQCDSAILLPKQSIPAGSRPSSRTSNFVSKTG